MGFWEIITFVIVLSVSVTALTNMSPRRNDRPKIVPKDLSKVSGNGVTVLSGGAAASSGRSPSPTGTPSTGGGSSGESSRFGSSSYSSGRQLSGGRASSGGVKSEEIDEYSSSSNVRPTFSSGQRETTTGSGTTGTNTVTTGCSTYSSSGGGRPCTISPQGLPSNMMMVAYLNLESTNVIIWSLMWTGTPNSQYPYSLMTNGEIVLKGTAQGTSSGAYQVYVPSTLIVMGAAYTLQVSSSLLSVYASPNIFVGNATIQYYPTSNYMIISGPTQYQPNGAVPRGVSMFVSIGNTPYVQVPQAQCANYYSDTVGFTCFYTPTSYPVVGTILKALPLVYNGNGMCSTLFNPIEVTVTQ
jgi:hypothetical protein